MASSGGENGEDNPAVPPPVDYQKLYLGTQKLYLETLAELEVQKNNLTSSARVLRTTQDELEKQKDVTRAVATQRDAVRFLAPTHTLRQDYHGCSAEYAEYAGQ